MGTPVAIKLIRQLAVDKAKQEIEVLFELRHPNIVGILGFFHLQRSQEVGILLELCSLGDLCSAYKQDWFTRSLGLEILSGCAGALTYMHSFPIPIAHRDLKSANVLLTSEKIGKIGDCGESRRVDLEATMTQIGTPLWAAPEILRAARYDEYVRVCGFLFSRTPTHSRGTNVYPTPT